PLFFLRLVCHWNVLTLRTSPAHSVDRACHSSFSYYCFFLPKSCYYSDLVYEPSPLKPPHYSPTNELCQHYHPFSNSHTWSSFFLWLRFFEIFVTAEQRSRRSVYMCSFHSCPDL